MLNLPQNTRKRNEIIRLQARILRFIDRQPKEYATFKEIRAEFPEYNQFYFEDAISELHAFKMISFYTDKLPDYQWTYELALPLPACLEDLANG